jgi:hypothetical protein
VATPRLDADRLRPIRESSPGRSFITSASPTRSRDVRRANLGKRLSRFPRKRGRGKHWRRCSRTNEAGPVWRCRVQSRGAACCSDLAPSRVLSVRNAGATHRPRMSLAGFRAARQDLGGAVRRYAARGGRDRLSGGSEATGRASAHPCPVWGAATHGPASATRAQGITKKNGSLVAVLTRPDPVAVTE